MTDHLHNRPQPRQCRCNTPPRWRYADSWCDVFRRGAVDALRQASREIDDPDVWVVLAELSERYETQQWVSDQENTAGLPAASGVG